MSISKEYFLNKIKDHSRGKNLQIILIETYQNTLRDNMIFVNLFVHQQITKKKDLSLNEYIIELFSYYKFIERIYKEILVELNSKKHVNNRYEKERRLENHKKSLDIMKDYLSFKNDVENCEYTPNELIDRLVDNLNRFSMYKKDKNLIYDELKFDLVESFGYDDGIHDVIHTHFGYWSNEYQLGYLIIKKILGNNFERVFEHFDDYSKLKSSLNSMKVNLKSPF
ncbi:hypothetical protein OAF78_02445 [Winogradskyella sp.]|nr:hypothetical protein [Winogradskyella sp.]MDB4752602.1 hypothetical protein [Winogradskyella sp.]